MISISVVIPVWNRGRTICRCLDSVAGQQGIDPGALEILVVDDASSDGTAEAVLEWSERHDDLAVRLIRHEQNAGAAAARNSGMAAARGQWIAFLDSDDVWRPEKLSKQLALLDDADGFVACGCGYAQHPESGAPGRSVIPKSPHDLDMMIRSCHISPGTNLIIPRAAVETVGEMDTGLVRLEDWDWLMRFLIRGRILIVPEALSDISTGHKPSFAKIADAIGRLRTRAAHDPAYREILATSERRRRFKAALNIQLASAAWHNRRYVTFAWNLFMHMLHARKMGIDLFTSCVIE